MVENNLVPTREVESNAIKMMLEQKKSVPEVQAYLKDNGYDYSQYQLRQLKKRAFQSLVEEMKDDLAAEFILDSVQKVTIEFEDLYDKYKTMLGAMEKEKAGNYEILNVMKSMEGMLKISLQKLGKFHSGVERVKADNINVFNNSDVVVAIQESQEKMFNEMQPELVDGKLVLNNPSAEIIDGYNKYKFKHPKSSGVVEILQ